MPYPPDNCLNEGTAFSALLSKYAPEPATMNDVERLDALDHLIAALVMLADVEMRALLLEQANGLLKLGKTIVKSRMRTALQLHASWLTGQMKRQVELAAAATPAQAVPPLERLTRAIAAAVPGFAFLLATVAPMPELLSDEERLKAADQVIAAVMPMGDAQLRDLYLDQAAARLGLKPKDLRVRYRSAQDAPNAPAGPAVGGEERDAGFHRAVIRSIGAYLDGLGLKPDAVSGWLDTDGRPATVKTTELVGDFFFENASFFESLSFERIKITLSAMTAKRRLVRRGAILATMTGKPANPLGQAELRKWLIAATHRDDPVDFAVMLHWIWQVKRLNTKRRVEWDLMPILVGRQGDGKSTAIQILCRPWLELMIGIKANNLTDDRSTEILSDYAIGFWGEMSGGNKADAAQLKSAMSSVTAHYRELGGHNHNSIVRRMAFIGDSNNQVRDVIVDATGARRFYEIPVPRTTDHDTLNAIDPVLIWQAVSEDDPAPFHAVADDVKERQKSLVHQDSFDHFVDWCDSEQWASLTVRLDDLPIPMGGGAATLTVPAYTHARGYTLVEIAVLFGHFIRVTKGTMRNAEWIARRLSESGWEKHRPRAEGGAKRSFYYRKPVDPADVTPAGPSRGEKAAAAPSPDEDLFAASKRAVAVIDQAEQREPGADEDEGPFIPPSSTSDQGGGDDIHL